VPRLLSRPFIILSVLHLFRGRLLTSNVSATFSLRVSSENSREVP
jgi:hypothetical protein